VGAVLLKGEFVFEGVTCGLAGSDRDNFDGGAI